MSQEILALEPAKGLPTPSASSLAPLKRYLTSFDNSREALQDLETNRNAPAIIEAAKAVLPSLLRQQAPTDPQVIIQALSMIAIDRPVKDKSEAHWKAHMKMFVDALKGFPADAITAGAKDVIADATIFGFPNVAQFVAKVEPHATKIRRAAWRAKCIAEARIKPPREPLTGEERARVASMLAELKNSLQARPEARGGQ